MLVSHYISRLHSNPSILSLLVEVGSSKLVKSSTLLTTSSLCNNIIMNHKGNHILLCWLLPWHNIRSLSISHTINVSDASLRTTGQWSDWSTVMISKWSNVITLYTSVTYHYDTPLKQWLSYCPPLLKWSTVKQLHYIINTQNYKYHICDSVYEKDLIASSMTTYVFNLSIFSVLATFRAIPHSQVNLQAAKFMQLKKL